MKRGRGSGRSVKPDRERYRGADVYRENARGVTPEVNRLLKTIDTNGTTSYIYDTNGNRIIKSGKFGEAVYVNPNYSVRNGDVLSKHVFAGNSRIASKLEMRDTQGSVDETGIYYVHPDHLGSSSVITTKSGGFHESIEYLPYGETWVHNKASETGYTTPYKFTGKEQDPETGLYYYGARYYDPVLSRWISTDPPMMTGEYLPSLDDMVAAQNNNEEYKPEESLPGMGGVYNPINIDVYHYAGQNPVKFVDPDGRKIALITFGGDAAVAGGASAQKGYIVQYGKNVEFKIYKIDYADIIAGRAGGLSATVQFFGSETIEEFLEQTWATGGATFLGYIFVGGGIARDKNGEVVLSISSGVRKNFGGIFKYGKSFTSPMNMLKNLEPVDLSTKEGGVIFNLFNKIFPADEINPPPIKDYLP